VPQVCQVMQRLKNAEDTVIDGPASGLSTRLIIRYILPRGSGSRVELPTLPETPLADDAPLPKAPDTVSRGLVHDAYGKAIMRGAAGDAFLDGGAVCNVRFGDDAAGGRMTVSLARESRSKWSRGLRSRFGVRCWTLSFTPILASSFSSLPVIKTMPVRRQTNAGTYSLSGLHLRIFKLCC
jgi:hypothetical protein